MRYAVQYDLRVPNSRSKDRNNVWKGCKGLLLSFVTSHNTHWRNMRSKLCCRKTVHRPINKWNAVCKQQWFNRRLSCGKSWLLLQSYVTDFVLHASSRICCLQSHRYNWILLYSTNTCRARWTFYIECFKRFAVFYEEHLLYHFIYRKYTHCDCIWIDCFVKGYVTEKSIVNNRQ